MTLSILFGFSDISGFLWNLCDCYLTGQNLDPSVSVVPTDDATV